MVGQKVPGELMTTKTNFRIQKKKKSSRITNRKKEKIELKQRKHNKQRYTTEAFLPFC